jgi:hypothetical protein
MNNKSKLQELASKAAEQLRSIANQENTLNISDEGICSMRNLASELETEAAND